jgi:regulator of protease activity HflC (stomatin/prohibitin superfamily)
MQTYVYTIIVVIVLLLASMIRILREYERGVIFRLGRYLRVKGPGLIILWPVIDKMVKVSLRVIAMDIPPQDVITKDNVSVKVNAVLYFRVLDPDKAVIEVEDFLYATSQLAQTTLRAVLGQAELDELLAERDDQHTDPWGIKVSLVEVKHVDLPEGMQRAIARQAEAERERRAKVIHAEGEFQASTKLSEAAGILQTQPAAIQLRFLQTMTEVSTERNSILVLPIPIDLIKPIMEGFKLPGKSD